MTAAQKMKLIRARLRELDDACEALFTLKYDMNEEISEEHANRSCDLIIAEACEFLVNMDA